MILAPHLTTAILTAIENIVGSNNGYADIGNNPAVADAVRLAGFVVIRSTNLHGAPTFRGSTRAAQTALAAEPFGVSTYRPITRTQDGPDFEALILARQDAAGELA